MKALTLWQPWASLMALGNKRIETRSWATSYRGPLAIHAAKRWPDSAVELALQEPFLSVLLAGRYYHSTDLPLGTIVAVVFLCGCRSITAVSPAGLSAEEKAFGDYTPGRFAWITTNPQRLDPPIPCRGRQGLWDVPPEIAARLEAPDGR